MAYREQPPPAALAHVVACLWHDGGTPGGEEKLILPDGCVDLILRAGEIVVAGPDTRPQPSRTGAGEAIAGLRLRTGTAGAVLGQPVDALRDARVALADLWGAEADRLAERAAGDPAVLAEQLAARIAHAAPDPRVRAAVARLAREPGAPVPALAADAGVGERQLRRRFAEAVGYGPRTLGRVVRYRRALRLLRAGEPPAAVAARAGYADQAHLTRELRTLAGRTPGAVLSTRG